MVINVHPQALVTQHHRRSKSLSTQLMCTKYYSSSVYFSLLLFQPFIPPTASTSNRTLRPTEPKMIENRGHRNKYSESYEAVEILSKRVTTLSHLSTKKGFSHTVLTKRSTHMSHPSPRYHAITAFGSSEYWIHQIKILCPVTKKMNPRREYFMPCPKTEN